MNRWNCSMRRSLEGIPISQYAVATRYDLNWCTRLFCGRISWLAGTMVRTWRVQPSVITSTCFAIVTLSRVTFARVCAPSPSRYRLHAVKIYYQPRGVAKYDRAVLPLVQPCRKSSFHACKSPIPRLVLASLPWRWFWVIADGWFAKGKSSIR